MIRESVLALALAFVLAFALALTACGPSDDGSQAGATKTANKEPVVEVVPSGRILKYGVYELVKEGKLREVSGTTTGKAIERPTIRISEQTDRIPMTLNTYFAYQYRISNLPDKLRVQFRRVLIHPEMTLPDGTVSTGSDFMIPGKVQRQEVFGNDGYAFSEGYELVEGDWIFQIWYEGNLMTEQRFLVYDPVGDDSEDKLGN